MRRKLDVLALSGFVQQLLCLLFDVLHDDLLLIYGGKIIMASRKSKMNKSSKYIEQTDEKVFS